MSRTALAFMSYVNEDDRHDNGWMTLFRERLSGEVRMQTGEPFDIFQDRKDISWGQQWQERINQSLDAVTFLFPILTPAFFKSAACRDELERFLKREETLGRGDLILPVYYVNCPVLSDKADKLAQVIAARQYADWRDLRFEDFTSPQLRKALAKMAQQIVEALERSQAEASRQQSKKESEEPSSSANTFQSSGGPQNIAQGSNAIGTQINYYGPQVPTEAVWQMLEENKPQPAPAAKTKQPTVIVDQNSRGDYATITEAIEAVKAGTRILVRPGIYQECIVIDKPVEILGDGERSEIVIEAFGKHIVLFQAKAGRLANLTLRQVGGGEWYGVNITKGRLELEDCDISSQSRSCVLIHGSANPTLRRNRIHDGKENGVLVYDNSQGMLEENDIFANMLADVEIRAGGNPTLRRNRIHDGKQGGILIWDNGRGTLEDNDIFANALSGVEIKTGGDPILRHNRIHDGKGAGVLILDNGRGTLEDNDIFANALSGVEIKTGGNPILRRNRIHDGKGAGVTVWINGQETLEENDIFANALCGVDIAIDSNAIMRRNRITQNGWEGIRVYKSSGGIFEDNDLRGNKKGAWYIHPDCEARVQRRGNKE